MTAIDRVPPRTDAERVAVLREIIAAPAPSADQIDLAIESLADERKTVQRHAAEAVAHAAGIVPIVVQRLEDIVTSGPWRERWGAVFALSLMGTIRQSALATLLEALDSDDGDVRWAAADLLKRLARGASALVTGALVQAAQTGTAKQRKMSLYLLRDLQFHAAADVARIALEADVMEVRLAALAALAALALDKTAAAAHVVTLMRDDDERMRRAAAVALGQLGVATTEVLSTLAAARQSGDPSLKRAAERALQALGARGTPEPQSEDNNHG
jgi:HEAT repeat protein